jgi:hypothetical protein
MVFIMYENYSYDTMHTSVFNNITCIIVLFSLHRLAWLDDIIRAETCSWHYVFNK